MTLQSIATLHLREEKIQVQYNNASHEPSFMPTDWATTYKDDGYERASRKWTISK